MNGWGFSGGLLLGLASSLHCAGMCGGISLTLMLGTMGPDGALTARRAMLAAHAGRILSYALLGALAGAMGAAALGGLDSAAGHRLLRWGAGLTLGWMGMAMLGLAPGPAFLDGPVRAVTGRLRMRMPTQRPLLPLIAGIGWGFMPCGMVYGALIGAIFAGSAAGGMMTMLGFGLGTLPSLVALGLGAARLSAAKAGQARLALGVLMIVTGAAGVLLPEAQAAGLCALPGL